MNIHPLSGRRRGVMLLTALILSIPLLMTLRVAASPSGAQEGTPTPLPYITPSGEHPVGWSDVGLPGTTNGLPPTSMWGGSIAGEIPMPCLAVAAPPGAHYWVSSNRSLRWGESASPPVITLYECGGEPDPGAQYVLVSPDGGTKNICPAEFGRVAYTLPPEMGPGTYKVQVFSRNGNAELGFAIYADANPRVYAHDAETGSDYLDLSHRIRLDYVRFPRNARIPVGIYRSTPGSLGLDLIDTWQIQTDSAGRYSELVSPSGIAPGTRYGVLACYAPGCGSHIDGSKVTVDMAATALNFERPEPTPPTQAITNYYTAINMRIYRDSWRMLTDGFKDRFTRKADGSCDYMGYVDFWNSVKEVSVGAVNVVKQSRERVTVKAELKYLMTDGRVIQDTRPFIELVWNETARLWQFDDKYP